MKPTIGRKVWFFEAAGTPEQDATVIDVHGERMVSLYVVNRGGTASSRRSVTLVQEGDEVPTGPHCTWMPYQKGQAAKTEALEAKLAPPVDTSDVAIESEIVAKGLTAPRVTPEHIDQLHCGLQVLTHHFPGTTCTVAIAALPDGFVAGVGHSACISIENFDADVGASIAKRNALNAAREKLWELEGYALRERLAGFNMARS